MTNEAIRVRHFDLSNDVEPPPGEGGALTVYWWGELPLGMQLLSQDEIPESRATLDILTARFAAEQRGARDPALHAPRAAGIEGRPLTPLRVRDAAKIGDLLPWLAATSAAPTTPADDLSLIICTRDRGEHLGHCLRALLAQRSPPGELIVVDNSSDGNAADQVRAIPGVRYLHEPQSGLSHARNAGVRAATRRFVAFTDDDVVPHPGWTSAIVAALDASAAEAVTGLVLPLRLDTPAQSCFQFDMGGFSTRFVPVLFDTRFFALTRNDGAHVWRIGAGANMAFRRSVFDRIGLFDPRLGAGASGCSEDSELWYRILATGGACLYEPRAVVFHDHRADWRGLERQVHAYMRGHVSALVAQRDMFGDRGNVTRIFKQLPRYFARTMVQTIVNSAPDRRRLLRHEVSGWIKGLSYLARPGWRRRRPALPGHPPAAGEETSR
ncbi:MAG: glycosyltransferase [Sphingomonas bacterium]|nr:glycosyltransferase [Sphingomonas bacterium]